jgi:hypothetical protein
MKTYDRYYPDEGPTGRVVVRHGYPARPDPRSLVYNPTQVYMAAKYLAKHNSETFSYDTAHSSIMDTISGWRRTIDNDTVIVSTGGYHVHFSQDIEDEYTAYVSVDPAINSYDFFKLL